MVIFSNLETTWTMQKMWRIPRGEYSENIWGLISCGLLYMQGISKAFSTNACFDSFSCRFVENLWRVMWWLMRIRRFTAACVMTSKINIYLSLLMLNDWHFQIVCWEMLQMQETNSSSWWEQSGAKTEGPGTRLSPRLLQMRGDMLPWLQWCQAHP